MRTWEQFLIEKAGGDTTGLGGGRLVARGATGVVNPASLGRPTFPAGPMEPDGSVTSVNRMKRNPSGVVGKKMKKK